jgi:hypothetical protein
MDNRREPFEFTELVLLALQGDILPEQMERLDGILKEQAGKIREYVDLMELCTELSPLGSVAIPSTLNDTAGRQDMLLHLLAEEEKTAPAVEIPREEVLDEPAQKEVLPEKKKTKTSKFPLFWLAANAAAIVLLILFAKVLPHRPAAADVATLVDQLNAQWSRPAHPPENGSRLWTDEEPLALKEGIVKIRYDTGVEVVIEGPACFAVHSSGMFVEYGRLYSCVSKTGLGFKVETPYSQFLDHGTEFGVLARKDGFSELHVLEGTVELFTGSRGQFKSRQIVPEKKAIQYQAGTGQVVSIAVQDESFVRSIHSESRMVWRGRMSLSLADIVGGGSGFEGGLLNGGIETTTGKPQNQLLNCYPFEGSAGYQKVDHPFIDGVFIPGAGGGKTPITSEGQAVVFPHASGRLWGYIFNGAFHQGTLNDRTPLQLGAVVYGTAEQPAITIHSNQGITFDLSEIRKSLPGLSIAAFHSLAGISQTVQDALKNRPALPGTAGGFQADRSKVEFWVFLDGKQAFHKELSSRDEPVELTIPIAESVRFLTLAVTESDDDISYDWALFGRPELILTRVRR